MKKRFEKIILLFSLLCFAGTISGQIVARHLMTPAQYQTEFSNLSSKGYRIISLCGYTKDGQERYAAIWNKASGPAWSAKHAMTAAQYQQSFTEMSKNGYRLRIISGYAVGGQAKFAAVWDKGSGGAWTAKHNMTAAQYQQTFTENSNNGYRLQYISGYVVGGNEFFTAIWEKTTGPATIAKHNMTAAQYQQYFNEYGGQGYSVKVVSGYEKSGTDLYAAIWEKSNMPLTAARHGIQGSNYQNVYDNMYYQGYVPVYVNGYAGDGADKYNVIWQNTNMSGADIGKIDAAVNSYMTIQGVTGLSLAVTKNGKLVFAKGYGYANPSTYEELCPNHSMRIMSISKSVTGAGIMKLMEANKISMNQKVFGPRGILSSQYATPSGKSKLNDITISQLLHHTAGLRTCNGESVFWDKNKSKDDVMKMLLASSDLLQYDPGTKSVYSNTGYFILSMVIEKLSGQSYENYIRSKVLTPSGVGNTMYVGLGSGGIKADEVHYIPDEKPNMQLWDGFGGWVARPIDLVKFLGRVDGSPTPPDIITAATHDTLTSDTPKSPGYGCGWGVSGDRQNHNGAHGPSRSWLAEIGDGLSIAIITNKAPSNDPEGHGKMLNEISAGVKSVSAFPNYNLF